MVFDRGSGHMHGGLPGTRPLDVQALAQCHPRRRRPGSHLEAKHILDAVRRLDSGRLLCGIGGGLYVQFSGAATPFVLDFSISGIALFMCLIGGRDNALGPLVGAFIYNIVTQYFLYGNNYPDIFTGGALMVVVVLLPGGLMSLPSIARAQRRRRASRGMAARHPANDTTE